MISVQPSSTPGMRNSFRRLIALCSLSLGCSLLGAVAAAGSGGGNMPINGPALSGGPSDDVVGLPMTAADASGITFVGQASELRSLGLSARGRGRIDVIPLPSGAFAVTFVGAYRIELDRAALARSRVSVLFRTGATFANGVSLLEIGDTTTKLANTARLRLPLARLAAIPAAVGDDFLALDVFAPRGLHHAHVGVDLGRARVTIFQRQR
jgi:hypothetical protein